jgi:hypothetical protein
VAPAGQMRGQQHHTAVRAAKAYSQQAAPLRLLETWCTAFALHVARTPMLPSHATVQCAAPARPYALLLLPTPLLLTVTMYTKLMLPSPTSFTAQLPSLPGGPKRTASSGRAVRKATTPAASSADTLLVGRGAAAGSVHSHKLRSIAAACLLQ